MGSNLVVNADDLGVSKGTTLGIVRAHRQGVVTSASLVTTTPSYHYALETCVARCPELGIGLHFTLSAGRPASPPHRVPLLINRDGFFRWGFGSLFRAIHLEHRTELLKQIEIELEAQLDRAFRDGVELDHINSERHVHLIPGIFDKVVSAARRRGIPYVRMGRDIGWRCVRFTHFSPLFLRGGFLKWLLFSALARHNRRTAGAPIGTSDHFVSYLYTGRIDLVMTAILGYLPAQGVTEIMVHPGIPEENRGVELGNRQLERYLLSEDRRAELEACIQARKVEFGARLCSFKELARMQESADAASTDGT